MAGRYKVAAKEDRTADNIVFDSAHEMRCYVNQFRPLMKSGIQVDLQKVFPLWAAVPNESGGWREPVVVSYYIADFVVTEKAGQLPRIYEAKGHQTADSKRTEKWFHTCYPHLRIVHI